MLLCSKLARYSSRIGCKRHYDLGKGMGGEMLASQLNADCQLFSSLHNDSCVVSERDL